MRYTVDYRRDDGMVYMFDSKSNVARREGSSPSPGTKVSNANEVLGSKQTALLA